MKDLLLKSNSIGKLDEELIIKWESYIETKLSNVDDFSIIEIGGVERLVKRTILQTLTIANVPLEVHYPIMRVNGFNSFNDDATGLEFIKIPNINLNAVYEKLIPE